jgi:hypothetical protein
VYNLHQYIKNDTDSTDVVENDYIILYTDLDDLDDLRQHIRGKIEEIHNADLYFVVNFAASL